MSDDDPQHPAQFDLPGISPPVADQASRRDGTEGSEDSGQKVEIAWASQGNAFSDDFEFLDDVHGTIRLNRLEVDVIDTPEFQRLFRLGQLGFVDLVYPTANHTRGTHSIGACFLSKKLVRALNSNNGTAKRGVVKEASLQSPAISDAEGVLISLAGLLHDIPHGPYSHDIEKKTHIIFPTADPENGIKVKSHYGPYEKHDNFEDNPALYVFLMNASESVLARVLKQHSPAFAQLLLRSDLQKHPHLADFVRAVPTLWPDYEQHLLPSLLYHLLVYEKPEKEGKQTSRKLRTSFNDAAMTEWGLGPKDHWKELHTAWYQPFRHDIVGDTLSADLLDYLARDQARLGMKNQLDLKLLSSYILVPWAYPGSPKPSRSGLYRCAIDLMDHKRGTFRAERLNDLFRLLDLRHQIHEKAVYHRVVQSSIAMLSRAALILRQKMPPLRTLYGLDKPTLALAGDDGFLQHLVQISGDGEAEVHQTLACKLAERRVYRPLVVIPGDRVDILLREICDFSKGLQYPLRELAAVIDSTFFSRFFLLLSTCIETFLRHALEDDSEDAVDRFLGELSRDHARLRRVADRTPKRVIFWTTPYKQLYKDPAILVCVDESTIATIEELKDNNAASDALRARVKAGLSDAETKNEALWKFYVFLSDGLFYTGAVAHVLADHPCARNPKDHEAHLLTAQDIIVCALRSGWQYWQLRNKSIDLSSDCKDHELAQLLDVYSSTRVLFKLGHRDIPSRVSAVKVDQYLHEDGGPGCRDVRYRFDTSRELTEVLEALIPSEPKRSLVSHAIRATGIDPRRVMGEEMAEIVSRFAAAPDDQLSELVEQPAARNKPVKDAAVRSLWRTELT